MKNNIIHNDYCLNPYQQKNILDFLESAEGKQMLIESIKKQLNKEKENNK